MLQHCTVLLKSEMIAQNSCSGDLITLSLSFLSCSKQQDITEGSAGMVIMALHQGSNNLVAIKFYRDKYVLLLCSEMKVA